MSVATAKPVSENRSILGPAGNRVRVSEEPKRKPDNNTIKKPQRPRNPVPVPKIPEPVMRNNGSVDSSCSSDSSSSGGSSAKKSASSTKSVRPVGFKAAKVAPDNVVSVTLSPPKISGPPKRCDWITTHSGKSVVLV